ncbi:MAG: hypothetical protein WC979_01505 [Candidatus Pacearchaeota archaeon]|jgi:hypothetical protein|nr:hypothetical protein [Clostridia bacterium]
MILNAKNNNFRLEIPKEFFYKDVTEKYEFYLNRLPVPYDNIPDFVNASIQGVSFPAAAGPTVDQTSFEDPIKWRGRGKLERWLTREFSITFKLYEGYINYWIMFEQLQKFYSYDQTNYMLNDFVLQFLDNTGFELIAFKFEKIIFTGISALDLSFSSNTPEFKTFTCDFAYNYPHIIKRLD